jgi:osmoprotectant transport system substrate-binding protein
VKTTRSLSTLALAAALVLSACGGSDSASDTTAAVTNPTINVGHTAEPISELLAEVYGQALESVGFRVGRKDAVADRAATNAGLESGSLQLVPEESGPLLASLGAEPPSSDTTATGDTTAPDDTTGTTTGEPVLLPGELQVAAMNDALPNTLTVNGAARAVTTPTVACTPAAVEAHSLTDLSSLAAAADDVELGVPADFDIETLAKAYGATFTTTAVDEQDAADTVAADADCVIVPAVSPVIISAGLLALDDDLKAIPVSVVAPVVAVAVSTPELINVLAQVNNALTTDVLRSLLVKAEGGSVSYDQVAKQFLATVSNGQ